MFTRDLQVYGIAFDGRDVERTVYRRQLADHGPGTSTEQQYSSRHTVDAEKTRQPQ